MTIDNVLEILEKHKLHIPSNVFYELKADIVNFEEPTTKDDAPENNVGNIEPTTKNDLGVDCISREDALMCLTGEFEDRQYEPSELVSIFSKRIKHLPSVTPQESVLDKIRAEIEAITPKAHIRTGKLSIDTELMIPLEKVLDVIDKYKAESEET